MTLPETDFDSEAFRQGLRARLSRLTPSEDYDLGLLTGDEGRAVLQVTLAHVPPILMHQSRLTSEATWARWSNARTAELWQAIALLSFADPEGWSAKQMRSVNYCIWRLDLAIAEINHGSLRPIIVASENLERSIVRFDYVRQWAVLNMIPIPLMYPVGGPPTDLRLENGPRATALHPPEPLKAAALVEPAAPAVAPAKAKRKPSARSLTADFIRESELLAQHVPFSRATLWRRIKEGKFPAPIKLSESISAWSRVAIEEWRASQTVSPRVIKSKAKV